MSFPRHGLSAVEEWHFRGRNFWIPFPVASAGMAGMTSEGPVVVKSRLISIRIKIPYTLFVCAIVPVYWIQYGPANFLWVSDIALFGTLAALWLENSFLLSMMVTGALLVDIVWNLVFFPKLIIGAGPEGLAGYMFDATIPVWIRALSLFHVVLPIVQLWAVNKLGYDARAWKYQTALGWIVLPLTYALTGPKENINWVFGITEVPQQWLPAPLYLTALMALYPTLICFPTHLVLKRLFLQQPRKTPADL